ncbi:MAG: ABC transporter substrate-binding protein [Anaerolineales bacterium]|nr:ABC transporter substrate-binding protein [Anaerolineales bacterium]
MKHIRILFVIALAVLLVAACGPAATPTTEPITLKIAVLPIIDTLPMYVARQEGLFTKHGVNVELVPVASAPERVQLEASGQVDGSINETLSVMQFNKDSVQMQAVRYALRPAEGYGHFFILASAQSGITTPDGLKNVEVGVSQGTVIEYVTERLLQNEGLSTAEIKTISVPKIPDRMALLASGELQAGTLPDPLGALAVQSGAVIVLDDSAHPEYGFSVYSFRKTVIDAKPEAVMNFLLAIDEAIALINADPTGYTDILSEAKIVPEPLLEAYKVPPFPAAGVPTEAEWNDALSWTKNKGMLDVDVSYADSVNPSLLLP